MSIHCANIILLGHTLSVEVQNEKRREQVKEVLHDDMFEKNIFIGSSGRDYGIIDRIFFLVIFRTCFLLLCQQ